MWSYKDGVSNMYPYPKVQFYDQHNADEASGSFWFHNQICCHSQTLKGYPGIRHCFTITVHYIGLNTMFDVFTLLNSR